MKVKKAAAKKTGTAKTAKAGKPGKSAKKEEEWLGEASQGEDELNLGSASEGEGAEEGEDEDEQMDDGDDGIPAGADVDDDGEPAVRQGSRILARLGATAPTDLNALKQQIQDDAALLGAWRKAKQMGETRSREEVFNALVGNCSTYFGYSEELAGYFLQMFSPEQALKFFEANEQHRPLTIRTNSLKARRSSLMQSLQARKVQCDAVGSWTKVGIKVYESAVPVGATPEYLGGHYMIQSASSFIPVMALAPQENETILDMAAAPGGKTTYIGQLMKNSGTLFANDLRRDRCKALVANVHRMGLTNVIVTNMDGKGLGKILPKLDRVLLDAPCTGSGIISRDPSVKVKRGIKDFEEHSRLQKELLLTAIDMVDAGSKSGGYIVYSTCSVSVEENEAVIDHALKVRNVELVSFSSAVGFGVEGLTKYRDKRFSPSMSLCRRFYPHVHNMDGFFVAKLKKSSNVVPDRMKKDRSRGTENIKTWGEEHWTPEVMNTVMDFTEPTAEGKERNGARLTKKDRKRIKRAATLEARAQAQSKAVQPAEPEKATKPEKAAKAVKRKRIGADSGNTEAVAKSALKKSGSKVLKAAVTKKKKAA